MIMKPLRVLCVLLFVGVLASVDIQSAAAQFGGYPAYGAWRGRARTVVRGDVSRSHVRWGGGLTPQFTNMTTAVLTNPDFLNAATGIAGIFRAEELPSERELLEMRALLEEKNRAEDLRQAAFRFDNEASIREILAQHAEIIARLQGDETRPIPAQVADSLDARTQRFLQDAKEIYSSNGNSSKLPSTYAEGQKLDERYGTIQAAIQETNFALKKLIDAKQAD